MSGAATPFASASARASLPPTRPASPALPPPTAPPSLPPPSAFDVLPDLHKLLKRLLETPSQPPAATPLPAQVSGEDPLDAQHITTAANTIRLKIQKARRAVLALPDIDRTCEDQQDEMEELEARIAGLKAALSELGRPATQAEYNHGDSDPSTAG